MNNLSTTPETTITEQAQQIAALCESNPFIYSRSSEYIESTFDEWVIHTEAKKVQGCCELIIGNELWSELGALMVDPSSQQKGLAKSLWEKFNKQATTEKAYAIVHNDNLPAQSFFDKLGVSTTENYPKPITETIRDMTDRVCFVWETGSDPACQKP